MTVSEGVRVPAGGESISVLEIDGTDRDVEEANRGFSVLEVREGNDTEPSQVFRLMSVADGTGFVLSLVLISPLDRETQDEYSLTVLLADSGSPSLGSSFTIQVTVADSNDLRPVFTSPNRAEIFENNALGATVIRVTAIDNDIGPNAVFNFTLNSQTVATDQGLSPAETIIVDYFSINRTTGYVTVNRPLDREDNHSFLLSILAEDSVGSTVQLLWVMVCEENDNSPLFDQPSFIDNVPENTQTGEVVARHVATDGDQGAFCLSDPPESNNQVRYELLSDEPVPFYVDRVTGEIAVNGSLDFENTREYNMMIFARDLGVPSLNSTVNLTIVVTDRNDNPPVLNMQTYFNLAVENATIGTNIINVITASDADSPPNDEVRYRLLGPGSADFSVDELTGVITTAQSLDRERIPVYNFTVEAFNPNTTLTDTANVVIEVADINDSPPVFNETSYFARTSENSPNESVVLTVFATDSDINHVRNIRYVFAEGSEFFDLNSTSGEITVARDLCADSNYTVELVVTAIDQPGGFLVFSSNVSVSILVFDDNRFAPAFKRMEYGAILPDGTVPGVNVLTLMATDQDYCSPPISYSIQPSPGSENFAIQSDTGTFSVNQSLNRASASEYFIRVGATDSRTQNPLMSFTTVVVLVGESVPLSFSTTEGYRTGEPRKIPGSSPNAYEQEFDHFFDATPTATIFSRTERYSATYGDDTEQEEFEISQLPATRAEAVLLTPLVYYDRRELSLVLVAMDEFGSTSVPQATLFVQAAVNIEGNEESVNGTGVTDEFSRAVVDVSLPAEWFSEVRSIRVSYGVDGELPIPLNASVDMVSQPNYTEVCNNTTPRLVFHVPSYPVYNRQRVRIPLLASRDYATSLSAVSISCIIGPGLEFDSEEPVVPAYGWAARVEPRNLALTFTASKQRDTEATTPYETVLYLQANVLTVAPDSVDIVCTHLEDVDTSGVFRQDQELAMVRDEECRDNIGTIQTTRDVLVGALSQSTQRVLVNDALITGELKRYPINMFGVVLAVPVRYHPIVVGGITIDSYTCSSDSDSILKVDSNCNSVFFDGSETSGADRATISLNADTFVNIDFVVQEGLFPLQLEYQVWAPQLPVTLYSDDTVLNNIEALTVPLNFNPNQCPQLYQSTLLKASAVYSTSSSSTSLRVEHLLRNLAVSSQEIIRLSGLDVTGIRTGNATITASSGLGETGRVTFNVVDNSVRVVELDTIYASDFSVSTPDSVTYLGSEPFLAYLDSSLLYDEQSADLVTTAVYSDATRMQISPNTPDQQLSYTSQDPSVFTVSDTTQSITAMSSGLAGLDVSWTSCGKTLFDRVSTVNVSLLTSEVVVQLSDTFLVHTSDAAAALESIATTATVRVELVYMDGERLVQREDITNSPDTVYSFSENNVLSLSPGGASRTLQVVSASTSSLVDLTVSYRGASSNVSVGVGYSNQLSATVNPYPAYPGSSNINVSLLLPVGNTGQFQRARVATYLSLLRPSESGGDILLDVTGHSSLRYEATPTSMLTVSQNGIITPRTTGSGAITVRTSNLQAAYNLRFFSQPVFVTSIDRLELTSNTDAIVGLPGSVTASRLSAAVTFSDGTVIEEVYTTGGQVIPGLLTAESLDPTSFSVNSPDGSLTVLGYSSPLPVRVSVTVNQDIFVAETLSFSTNLEPGPGLIDLGWPVGEVIQSPIQHGAEFSIPLRVNTDFGQQSVGAMEIGVAYSWDLLELVSVDISEEVGPLFETSARELRGYVLVGGVIDSNTFPSSGIITIATLRFRVLTVERGIAGLRAAYTALLDNSNPPQNITVPTSPAASIAVVVESAGQDAAIPELSEEIMSANSVLSPSVTQCSNGVPVDGREIGDLNGDCVFNIADVLAFNQSGCSTDLSLPQDYNSDGICSHDDVVFLLRANFRIVQFLTGVDVTAVNDTEECFLTISVSLNGRGDQQGGGQTSLLLGLFHRDTDFQQQFDETTSFINIGRLLDFNGTRGAGSNGGFIETQRQSPGTHNTVLITPIDKEDVRLILVQARVDAYGTLSSVDRTQIMVGSPLLPLDFPGHFIGIIQHPLGLNIPVELGLGFSALDSFDQTFSSLDCINDNRPVFFPQRVEVEVYENQPVNTFVAMIFANDSDAGPNADISYVLHNVSSEIADTFSINSSTGVVTLISSLDRETTSLYSFAVRAVDNGVRGRLDGIGQLDVRVLDVNDEVPRFDEDPYMVTVGENIPVGREVITVRALDLDLGENASVTYTLILEEPDDEFAIDNITGDISTIASLDFERKTQYNLTVLATDGGIISLTGTASVIVDVMAINDNIPMCDPIERLAIMPEDTFSNAIFFVVNASDADEGDVLTFTLNSTSPDFGVVKISEDTAGLIALTENFDRSLSRIYSVVVTVTDSAGQYCTMNVTIVVGDPSRFDFDLNGAGYAFSPVRPIRGREGYSQDITFFRNSLPNGTVTGVLGGVTSSATYTRGPMPVSAIRGILREEELWSDRPIISAVTQVPESYVAQSLTATVSSPDGTNTLTVTTCAADTTAMSGLCEFAIQVPQNWFNRYEFVNVSVSDSSMELEQVMMGQVYLRSPLPAQDDDGVSIIIMELPLQTLYSGSQFNVWVGAPADIDVTAFTLSVQFSPAVEGVVIISSNKWSCIGNGSQYHCYRTAEGASQLSPYLGTDRFLRLQGRVGENHIMGPVDVTASVDSLVSSSGYTVTSTTTVAFYGREGVVRGSTTHSLNFAEQEIRGIFASTPRPELINTVPSNSDAISVPVTVYVIYNQPEPQFGEAVTPDATCTSSSDIFQQAGSCDFTLSADFQQCDSMYSILVNHTSSGMTFELPIKVWCLNDTAIVTSDSELRPVSDWLDSDCSGPVYQQSQVILLGQFQSGEDVSPFVDLTDYFISSLVSGNTSVVSVDADSYSVSGVSGGVTTLELQIGPILSTLEITVSDEAVYVYSVNPEIATSLEVSVTPDTYTSSATITASAVITEAFDSVSRNSGSVSAFVYFTDGARYDIPESELRLMSVDTNILSANMSSLTANTEGRTDVEISWVPQTCPTQSVLGLTTSSVRVVTPFPIRLDAELTSSVIAGETRGVSVPGLPETSQLSLTLLFSNDTSRVLTDMEDGLSISAPDFVNITEDLVVSVLDANDTTTAQITVTYSQPGSEPVTASVNLEIMHVTDVGATVQEYPSATTFFSDEITLEIIVPASSYYQHAEILPTAILSNGSSAVVSASYSTTGTLNVNIDDQGVVTPVAVGSGIVDVTVGEFPPVTVLISVQGLTQTVQEIRNFRLIDISTTEKQISADLFFSDNSIVYNAINYDDGALSDLVTFSVLPPDVAIVNQSTWRLDILDNHYDLVTLLASPSGLSSEQVSIQFPANLDVPLGGVDLGQPQGVPQPPVSAGEYFYVDVRANIGSETVGAMDFSMFYDDSVLEVNSVETMLPGLSVVRTNDPTGEIQLIYIGTEAMTETEPTILRLNFTTSCEASDGVTVFNTTISTLINTDLSDIGAPGSGAVLEILVQNGSSAPARARRNADTPVRLSITPAAGDANGDGAFNVRDGLYVLQLLAGTNSATATQETDANGDGQTTVADVIYLSRAAAGLLPFLHSMTFNPVSQGDCLLEINATLAFPTTGPRPASTSVYFILSYPEQANLIASSLVGNEGSQQMGTVIDNTSVMFPARAYDDVYSLILYTPIDVQYSNIGITTVVLSSDALGMSSTERLAVFTSLRSTSFIGQEQLIPLIPELNLPNIQGGVIIGEEGGFSPLLVFNNTLRSDYCTFADSDLNLSVPEDFPVGDVVYNISASDPAFPSTAEVYTLTGQLGPIPFNVSESGMIVLTAGLDFETETNYSFTVNADSVQAGYNIGQTTITVTVLDVNDFAPEFLDTGSYSTTIREDAPLRASVFTVSARDQDTGINAMFTYSIDPISNPGNKFRINQTGFIDVLNTLDREDVDRYELVVLASDMGIPTFTGTAVVNITIEDVNDETPVLMFDQVITVLEDTPETTVIPNFQITATDADEGPNAVVDIVFEPLDPMAPFMLLDNGSLIVTGSLDREEIEEYEFTVTATDQGEPPLSSNATLIVLVGDVNDGPPMFINDPQIMFVVEEDKIVGTQVYDYDAMDMDSPSNAIVTFSIVEYPVPFAIDSSTGVLRVNETLDIDARQEYSLTIRATDSDPVQPMYADLMIIIEIIEGQVITFDVGSSGYLLGQRMRVNDREYTQRVGYLLGEDISQPVSVSGGINYATSNEVDQAELPNLGDIATSVRASLLQNVVSHSLRTVNVFVQVFDDQGRLSRPTMVTVRVVALSSLGGGGFVEGTCVTSADLGFCIARIRLPDEWFARDSTDQQTDIVRVWSSAPSAPDELIGQLVVEHSEAHAVDFTENRIVAIPPSHSVYTGQNFSVEVYVVSPRDRFYTTVDFDIVPATGVPVQDISFDETIWDCSKCTTMSHYF